MFFFYLFMYLFLYLKNFKSAGISAMYSISRYYTIIQTLIGINFRYSTVRKPTIRMRFLFFAVLLFAVAFQTFWTPSTGQFLGTTGRLADRADRMMCRTGCTFLASSHRKGCCSRYKFERCCNGQN